MNQGAQTTDPYRHWDGQKWLRWDGSVWMPEQAAPAPSWGDRRMASTEIITFRAANHRQQRRTMSRKLGAIQRRHPDARVASVNVARRSALQWSPCQLDVTMVVEWADATAAVGAAHPGGTWGSAAGQLTGPAAPERSTEWRWFAGLTTWQKIFAVVLLWPFMALYWLWTNPGFTTKTKAIVTAASIAAIAVMSAFGSTSGPTTSNTGTSPTTSNTGRSAATTPSIDAYTDSVTGAGVSCEELSGMWESARRDKDLVQAATYVAAWEKYCSQYGSIAARAH